MKITVFKTSDFMKPLGTPKDIIEIETLKDLIEWMNKREFRNVDEFIINKNLTEIEIYDELRE